MVRLTLQPVFTHLHEVTSESPSEDLKCMWTVLTKSKKSICQGDRLENLSWRLWYTSTRGFRRLLDDRGNLLESESSLNPKNPLNHLATPLEDENHHLNGKSSTTVSSDNSVEYSEFINGNIPKTQPLSVVSPFRFSSLQITESSPSPSHKFILQSLSNVLEEIRDSVPTKKQSKSHHSATDSTSYSLSRSSGHSNKSLQSSRQRTMTYSHTESNIKTRPNITRDNITRHPTRSCLSSHNESEPEAIDSHYSSGTEVKSQPGYSSQNSSISPTSKSRIFGESSLQGPRSNAAAQRLSRIYHATGRTNKTDLPGYALDEEQYKEDPNDPYQHIPVTTFPYDEQQFQLAGQAFRQTNTSTTSLNHQKKTEGIGVSNIATSASSMEELEYNYDASANSFEPVVYKQDEMHKSELGALLDYAKESRTSMLSLLLSSNQNTALDSSSPKDNINK